MSLAQLRAEVERGYWKGLMEAWFPASVDHKRGGFYEHMDRAFQPTPEQDRFVVYQSRLTWSAAQAALKGRGDFKEWAHHGLESLWNTHWDKKAGGFYWWSTVSGEPSGRSREQKHTYGLAFGLYATAAAARALGTPDSLAKVQESFNWFSQNMHDDVNGGWFEVCDSQSRPLLEAPSGWPRDIMGLSYGTKAQNSQLHVMEALTEIYRAWPDAKVAERLREMVQVMAHQMRSEEGHLHLSCTLDWKPLTDFASHGHDIEAAFLLRDALDALGDSDPAVEQISRDLARHALEHAWDKEHGGLIEGGGRWGPVKIWWVQAESLGALAYMATESKEAEEFFAPYLMDQWAFIRDHMLDPEHGGLYPYTSQDGKEVKQPRKGDPWSGLYHEARAFLTVMDRIAG